MKRYITILIAAISLSTMATAQNGSNSIVGARVDVKSFVYEQDSVTIDLEYNFDQLEIGVNESAIFSPNIFKGENSLTLPSVVARRRGGARSQSRAEVLGNKKSVEKYDNLYGEPYQVVEYYGSEKITKVPYSVTIPYESWMVDSKLYVDCSTYGCCSISDQGALQPKDNQLFVAVPEIEQYEIKTQVELIKPEKVAVKRRDIQYSSALVFRVNSTYIDPNLEGNRSELASIDEMMQSVISDEDYTVTKVNIIGYASPEGSLAANMRLSEGRATSLEVLLKQKYRTINPRLYSVLFGGENWEKLHEIVSDSHISHKAEILNLIDNVPIEEGRETKLMALNGGETYRYLLKNIFPLTRLVVIDVEYNIDAYDLDRIGELIDTKPQNLSLEEMYRLSENYAVHDKEFENIFLTAARIYPDDEVALNNALVTGIRRGDISRIGHLAERVDKQTELAELANSLGVYYMLAEEYQTAEKMLQRAVDLGSRRAQGNMEQLKAKLENIEQIEANEALKAKIYGR